MLHDHLQKPSQPAAEAPERWQPEDIEAAWARVLDCGACGPSRNEPALFYQAGAPPADVVDRQDPDEEADDARAS